MIYLSDLPLGSLSLLQSASLLSTTDEDKLDLVALVLSFSGVKSHQDLFVKGDSLLQIFILTIRWWLDSYSTTNQCLCQF